MNSVSKSWQMIEDVLRENAHSVFRALRKPATAAQVQRLERKLPAKLPRDFVASLKIHDGLRDSYLGQVRLFNYWALLPVSAILDKWNMMNEFLESGDFDEPVWKPSRAKVDTRIKSDFHWRPGWVPLLDADGDTVWLDLDPGPKGKVGQVFEWSNSGGFSNRLLADSFGEWLADLAVKFAEREFRLDKYGGIWLGDE